MALTDNIIYYTKLDGNSNDAVGSNNGTDTSIVYSVPNGKINQGAGFGGASGISIADAASLKPTTSAITWGCWVKYSSTTANQRIFQKYDSTNGFILLTDDGGATGKLKLYIRTASGFTGLTGSTNWADGNWHLAYGMADGTNLHLYVDNTEDVAAVSQTGNLTNSSNSMKFGVDETGGAGFYTGDIDEGFFYAAALSAPDRASLWNGGAGNQYPFTTAGGTSQLTTLNAG